MELFTRVEVQIIIGIDENLEVDLDLKKLGAGLSQRLNKLFIGYLMPCESLFLIFLFTMAIRCFSTGTASSFTLLMRHSRL